ncbi:MAG: discoidin domain-containing protein [Fibrobacteria bacterium]|nr:discoidin domain-containing protein [Fibrobacteria bacterium]
MWKKRIAAVAALVFMALCMVNAGHPTGKLVMVDAARMYNLSYTYAKDGFHWNYDELINAGFNGVHIRLWTGGDDDYENRKSKFVKEAQEAGLWVASSPVGHSEGDIQNSAEIEARWGVDFLQFDEPYDFANCEGWDAFWGEAFYNKIRDAVHVIDPNIPVLVTDVVCNTSLWNWENLDGLVQEVYVDAWYPDMLNSVINYKETHPGKEGYVWLYTFTKQPSSCVPLPDATYATWFNDAYNRLGKIILFQMAARCDNCISGDCQDYGNNWDHRAQVTANATVNERVAYHEWGDYSPSSEINSATTDCQISVRSREAGLDPSTVKCFYTTQHRGFGHGDTDEGNRFDVLWKEWKDVSCTGTKGSKEWLKITAKNVPFSENSVSNAVRFKIQDTYTGTYYRNARWSQKEFLVKIAPVVDSTNLVLGKPVTASSEYKTPSHAKENGADGSLSTYWASAKEEEPYFQVDLEAPYVIGKFEVVPMITQDLPKQRGNFQVWASNTDDFSDYELLFDTGDSLLPFGDVWAADVDNDSAYRYIRVQRKDSVKDFLSLVEFRVWEAEVSGIGQMSFHIPSDQVLVNKIDIVNVQGQIVRTLTQGRGDVYRQLVSGGTMVGIRGLKSGVYLARIQSDQKVIVQRFFVK